MSGYSASFDEIASVNLFRRYEREVVFGASNAHRQPVPVTLITGALGSGSTTLLRHILSRKMNLNITAIVNDFAAINIDEKLIKKTNKNNTTKPNTNMDEAKQSEDLVQVHELSNGCMCCVADLETQFEQGTVMNKTIIVYSEMVMMVMSEYEDNDCICSCWKGIECIGRFR